MANDGPLVSIILPTYNRATMLPQVIDSVTSQTYANWELVIWNDGSQDGTEEVIDSYHDSRIRHYGGPNRGMSYALNRGTGLARGSYIAFLDDDDRWTERKLSHQMDFLLDAPQSDLIFGNFRNIDLASGRDTTGFEQLSEAMANLEIEGAGGSCFRVVGGFLHRALRAFVWVV